MPLCPGELRSRGTTSVLCLPALSLVQQLFLFGSGDPLVVFFLLVVAVCWVF